MTDYPVSIGNVTYLDGQPPQEAIEAMARSMSAGIDESAYIERFRAEMKLYGRPCKEDDVEVWYAMTLNDLLRNGSLMFRAPWYEFPHRMQSGSVAIVQVLNGEGVGWWAEIAPGVLLHTKTDGHKGLNAHEMACFLTESETPAPALMEWLQEKLVPDAPEYYLDLGHFSEDMVKLLSWRTQTGRRIVSFSNTAGTAENPRYYANERPNFDFMF
ncbi:hypothetical protein [Pseudomonas serbica]|uniref:hypothetical protein n=1 Tax=Pseudomonas serbica TaxID=2965074 RepID=UPI00237A5A8A|nr:hypothetical protein [Pseudomonas serbica]